MRQIIVQEAFTCDNCSKIEVRQKIIERDWITVKVTEFIIKDFCCKECKNAFEERENTKELQAEYQAPHGI